MSIAVIVGRKDSEPEFFSLVGNSELNALWKPIIERKNLYFLDYIVTAGLSINAENCDEVIEEVRVLLREIETLRQHEDDFTNPVFRVRRALSILESWNPHSDFTISIG